MPFANQDPISLCPPLPVFLSVDMADLSFPVEKISISGTTLASILQRFSSSPGDVDGLLFGHFTPLPPADPHDDDPSSSSGSGSPSSPFSASITGHFSCGTPMSFYDSIGCINPSSLHRATASAADDPRSIPLGWFSGRRCTALRPSMRELAVSNSLYKTLTLASAAADAGAHDPPPGPCIFILLSSSSTENQAIHTHEYRAFAFRRKSTGSAGVLEPRSLHVVNIGPAFRGQYGSFTPESELPWMPWRAEDELTRRDSVRDLQDMASAQRLLDSSAEGFTMERLARLVGPGVADYASEMEGLYRQMLLKLEGLARKVEKGSARVLEQENRNLKLRCKLAGLE